MVDFDNGFTDKLEFEPAYELTYKIPEDISTRIPEYFWAAFAGELVAIFSPDIFAKDEDGFYNIEYTDGTGGWSVAFKMTCCKLNIDWLFDYYVKLPWDDSDLFDGELSDILIQKFVDNEDCRNAYHRWLVQKQ